MELLSGQLLSGQRAVVTGGSRGLGLGIVEALVERGAKVTVVARDQARLAEVSSRLGVEIVSGDVTDEGVARSVLSEIRPTVLVLNAGATPTMGPLHEHTWESFNVAWNVDVKAAFHWIQHAILLPLPVGSKVIIGSSGAALSGSPLSGGYAGAKRMQMFMAGYASDLSNKLGLGIRFQAIVPQQIIGETELGRAAADAYARAKGVSREALLASFGPAMPPARVGDHVVSILTDPNYASGVAFGLKGDLGIVQL